MQSRGWVTAHAQAMAAPGTALHCVLAHDQGRLVGILPLIVSRAGPPWVRLARASTPYSEHTALGDILADPAHAGWALPAILRAACVHPSLRLCEVALRGVAEGSPTLQHLPALGNVARQVKSQRSRGSFLPLAAGWDACRDAWSKNFRANLRKAHNRLHEAGMPESGYIWLSADEAQPRHLQTFVALEASGWKGLAGSAIGRDASVRRFYAELVEQAFRCGSLEWHFMTLGGETIAAHLAIRSGRRLHLLKIAYDERHARLSPGSLLFEATAQRACTQGGTDEIDCLTDMAWHRPWNMPQRDQFDVRLYPRTLAGDVLGWAPRRAIDMLKPGLDAWPRLGHLYAKLRRDRAP